MLASPSGDDRDFVRVGGCRLSAPVPDLLTFAALKSGFSGGPFEELRRSDILRRGVRAIAIVVFSTLRSGPPCLADLAVFGRPVGRPEGRGAHEAVPEAVVPQRRSLFYHGGDEEVEEEEAKQAAIAAEAPAVPDEDGGLLDALTHLPMTSPLVLPSGHIVDRTTLETYSAAEERWGRPPNDPFTRRPFTRDRRPVCYISNPS